jgi:hypothetical protein
MIPVELVYILAPLAMALSVYAVWNLDNRIYANIVMGGFTSSILWFFLAANVVTENIFYTYTDLTDTMVDMPLFWVFMLLGAVMSVYTLALALEAVTEHRLDMLGGEE